MANRSAGIVLRHIHRLAALPFAGTTKDSELLDRFARRREEAAFAALVERHGPMVLRVCRRVLQDRHAAEDAFQATFLVLVKKAGAIGRRELLANWLYGVAYRIAMRARTDAAKRENREARAATRTPGSPVSEAATRELCAVLDEELNRLPDKYRAPLLLCYLEGQTRDEAAKQLHWSLGTLKRRLEQGRECLRRRLTRRGVTFSAALASAALCSQASSAVVPAGLAHITLQAAQVTAMGQAAGSIVSANVAALADSTLKSLSLMKLKLAAVLLVGLCVLGAGAGVVAERAFSAGEQHANGPQPVAKGKQLGRAEETKREEPKSARTDRYGDPLPERAIARLGTVRFRHGWRVDSAEFSPDGKTIASAGMESVKLWDAATGKELRRLGKAHRFLGVVFSPDGKLLVSSEELSPTNRIHVWDVATGKELWQVIDKRWSVAVAFAPDSKTLVMAGYRDDDPAIIVLDAATGRQLRRIEGPAHGVFSPDGKLLASAGDEDRTISLWDVATGKKVATLQGHVEPLWSKSFSPDGTLLVTTSRDSNKPDDAGEIKVWDVAGREEQARFKAPAPFLHCVGFSPNGKILASGHSGGLIVLLDAATGKEIRRWQAAGMLSYIIPQFSPDGKTLVSTAGVESDLRLWNVATGKEISPFAGHHTPVDQLAFSANGKDLFSWGKYQGILRWNIGTGQEQHWFDWNIYGVGRCAPSPDGKMVATWARVDRTIRLWDAATGKQLRLLGKHQWESGKIEAPIHAVVFSPDGKLLAAADQGPAVRVWNVTTGAELHQFHGLQGETCDVAFSPDGKTLAALGSGKEVRLWDVATGKELRIFEAPGAYFIAFSPDGKLLALPGYDRPTRLWDVASGKEAGPPIGPAGKGMFAITFSPDGRFLAGTGREGDKTVYIWEVSSRQQVRRFRGHDSGAGSVAFSPDGRVLASGGGDSAILLWDLTGRMKDGRLQPARLSAHEIEARWNDLAGDDAARALQAAWELVASPREAVPFLKKRLRPAEGVPQRQLAALIADLDSNEFQTREKAAEALEKLGELAEPALRKTLTKPPSPEVRRRITRLLEKVTKDIPSGERLRALRIMLVLEQIGTPEAGDFLMSLAQGAAEARLTQEAKASLERLAKRPPAKP